MGEADNTSADGDAEIDESAANTDWLAVSARGWGVGYTKHQALAALAMNATATNGESVEVNLIEHVGEAEMSAMSTRVEHMVRDEKIHIPVDDYERLREAAIMADARANDAYDRAEKEDIEH